ncbi:MAG TPA: prepilin-type N-terminal cleavage/methylation domain-containing protein [Candidatus Paceibacterota bacterium]|nr:prepilin-type N-terminal cleavage/methylation domain-containing protein [Candidatus Paceibacterota bacterium]
MAAQRFNKLLSHNSQSFTLIEMLITIAIIAVLMTVTVVAINPNEMTKKARDTQRLTDMSNLQMIMELARSEGMLNSSYCDGTKIYASLPSETPLSNSNLPAGVSWAQVSRDNIRNADGTGWLPFNFKNLVGLQVSVLPVDPKNSLNDSLYYTFYCNPQRQYIFTAYPESKTFGPKGGKDSKTIGDGGPDPYVYEVGNNLFISPLKPVGSWSFEEGGGTIAADSSGNNSNGTLMSGPTWTNGQVGGALSFDGSDDYVDINHNSTLMPLSITVEGWIKFNPTETGSWMLIDKGAGGNAGVYYLYSDNLSGCRWTIYGPTGTRYDAAYSMNFIPNNWYHLVGTFNASSSAMNLYINGELKSTTNNAVLGSNTSNVFLGRYVAGYYLDGLIDEVRIYNRALSAEEIKRHYEESK